MTRLEEVNIKEKRLQKLMDEKNLSAILLKKQNNFTWLTGGSYNMVWIAAELGMTSLLVTRTGRYLISNKIEAPRMQIEEGLEEMGFEPLEYEWEVDREAEWVERIVGDLSMVGSDVVFRNCLPIEEDIKKLRYSLTENEVRRYLFLGEKLSVATEKVLLGYSFMGKAHTNAFKKLPYIYYPPPAIPVLKGICGRSEKAIKESAERFGYEYGTTDWKRLIDDREIELFDNNGPNNIHKDPCIAALEAGKHTIVEKPLAMDVDEARMMVEAARRAEKKGVKNMVAFNYRFSPAVLLARRLIQEGKIGQIYHYRATFLQDWLVNPDFPLAWRLKKEVAGSGVLGDLNSHIIDMARFLTGLEIVDACGITETFIKERPVPLEAAELSGKAGKDKGAVTVDDASLGMFRLNNGALGSIEATRFATGRKSFGYVEVNGNRGSLHFELTQNNILQYFSLDDTLEIQGFRTILITEAEVHDFIKHWWPPGHMLGWEHNHCNAIFHFVNCIVNNLDVAPLGATFEDGLKCQLVLDALQRSEKERGWVKVEQ